jgi:nucleotide-binding universal stress UspA family protein
MYSRIMVPVDLAHGKSLRKAMTQAGDLDGVLRKRSRELGADLVVMASQIPRFHDSIFGSHAGAFVRHSDVSVFVVR